MPGWVPGGDVKLGWAGALPNGELPKGLLFAAETRGLKSLKRLAKGSAGAAGVVATGVGGVAALAG